MSKTIKFESVKNFFGDVAEHVPEGATIERKAVEATLTANDSGLIEAVFNSTSTDRDGDIVYPGGCVSDYYSGVVCWNHSLSDPPIGRCDDFQIGKDSVTGKIKLSDTYAFAKDIFGLVKEGIIRGISVGFIPIAEVKRGTRAFADFVEKTGIKISEATERIVTKWEWIEVSLCPIGCNRDALIQGIASKSLTVTDAKTEEAFGLDRTETKSLIELTAKVIETQDSVKSLQDALQSLQAKAMETPAPVETKAAAVPVALNPVDLSVSGFLRALKGQETTLTESLNSVWSQAAEEVAKVDMTKPIADVSTEIDGILSGASSQADAMTRAQVEAVSQNIFDGFTTGYNGEPIKDIEKVDAWRKQWVEDYMSQLQPDPSKPLQATTVDAWKNDALRAIQAGEQVPALDMGESNITTSTQATFGVDQNFVTGLMAEAGTGDIVQVQGTDDEKLCDACKPWLDQFLSVSGASQSFQSVEGWKSSGAAHPRCRCILVPVTPPKQEEKAVEAVETKEIPKPQIVVKLVKMPVGKAVMTPELRNKAQDLARGVLI